MSARKAKRQPKAPRAAERPTSPLEQQQAILKVHRERGLTSIPCENPFFCDTSSTDTINMVRCGLTLFSNLSLQSSGLAMSTDMDFGQSLILKAMLNALAAAMEQGNREDRVAYARGFVAAAEGVGK